MSAAMIGLVAGGAPAPAAQPTRDAPYPDIHATSDRGVIKRGRYLVLHVAVCGHCHSETNGVPGDDGEVKLSGGSGMINAPNITSDTKTGIGALSDAEIARALRYDVGHDGRALAIMNFNLADDDLRAVISYLRTLKPIEKKVTGEAFNFQGMAAPPPGVAALPAGITGGPPQGMTTLPAGKSVWNEPLKKTPRGVSPEKGRYLVEEVGDCGGCHSPRSFQTGEPSAPAFSGGTPRADERDPKRIYWVANITSGGRLATMSEKDFVTRIRAGRLIEGSPMPWEALQGMNDDDARSIYRYLKSVPAAVTPEHPPVEITQ
jgi:mono/diheme cytochrome c family protein